MNARDHGPVTDLEYQHLLRKAWERESVDNRFGLAWRASEAIRECEVKMEEINERR